MNNSCGSYKDIFSLVHNFPCFWPQVEKLYFSVTVVFSDFLCFCSSNPICYCEKKNKFHFYSIDPRGRPQSRLVVITIFTQSFLPYVRKSVPKLQNQATSTTGRDCGLAEWIIDDNCLVIFSFSVEHKISSTNQSCVFLWFMYYTFCGL